MEQREPVDRALQAFTGLVEEFKELMIK